MAKPKRRDLPDLSAFARPGTGIDVRVTPGAARDRIETSDGTVRIYVTTAPEAGKANKAVRALLARAMGVPVSSLVLKQGQSGRQKRFVYDP